MYDPVPSVRNAGGSEAGKEVPASCAAAALTSSLHWNKYSLPSPRLRERETS